MLNKINEIDNDPSVFVQKSGFIMAGSLCHFLSPYLLTYIQRIKLDKLFSIGQLILKKFLKYEDYGMKIRLSLEFCGNLLL